ncbi:formyltransferase family protein [Flavobacterium piscis]|uniref:Methionyl-tRNA formyltransferase n=1 Tax=Flavobacterium piscis TaxID=1114874 RepID=A0ABU1YEH6_9FLAO|nr:formyltransferase family protein [Flavobacterium piscis]MDR7212639.1 methionyl-tRNA formyltransferase [Flavobacterium piscis]
MVAVGSSNHVSETVLLLEKQCTSSSVSFEVFEKNNLGSKLTLWLELHQPDVVLVKTFPWKIPAAVLSIPKFGFINFHYAPLPAFRGTNPLFWMIRNLESTGGVTVHQMDENLDTGDLLITKEVPIYPEASFGMLIGQLAYTGLELTMPLIQGLANGTLKPKKQNSSNSKWYSQPKQKDLFIDWKVMSSWEVRALVKACNPWQKGAAARYKGWLFGITDASLSFMTVAPETSSGTVIVLDESNGLIIVCADGKAIKVEVVYSEEGYFPGHKMTQFGLRKGDKLD